MTETSRIYLKGKLYRFKMQDDKSTNDNLNEFNKVIINLENTEIKVEDGDQAVIILNYFPKSHATFIKTMKYARDSLILEEAHDTLKSKEIENKVNKET